MVTAQGYELMIIMHPDAPEEDVQALIEKTQEAITGAHGEFVKARRWGKRKMVYKIKGFLKGFFILVYFRGEAETLPHVDMVLRYNEQVLRYQTIKLDKHFDLEAIPEDEPEASHEQEESAETEYAKKTKEESRSRAEEESASAKESGRTEESKEISSQ